MLILSSECALSDLQDTFLKYPGALLLGGSLMTQTKENEEGCVEICRKMPVCRTVVYDTLWHYCFIHNKTVLDVPDSQWITERVLNNAYQPMCA